MVVTPGLPTPILILLMFQRAVHMTPYKGRGPARMLPFENARNSTNMLACWFTRARCDRDDGVNAAKTWGHNSDDPWPELPLRWPADWPLRLCRPHFLPAGVVADVHIAGVRYAAG